jgi:hypothetical protein
VASAGRKISRAPKEVQPGATLFLSDKYAAHQEKNSSYPGVIAVGAFHSENQAFCSKREQEMGYYGINSLGATNSQETGCTLFGLLNRIRAQGATVSQGRFTGRWLSWGNIGHKCAEHPIVCQTYTFGGEE